MPLIDLDNLQRFKENLEATHGAPNGLAVLDSTGHVPDTELPDSVYNVLEYLDSTVFPEEGKINTLYVDKDSNNIYRWNGETYENISSPDSVKYIQQALSSEQKQQARSNISAASAEIESNTVRFDEDQTDVNASHPITAQQQAQARTNIGAVSSADFGTLNTTVGEISSTISGISSNIAGYNSRITAAEQGIDALESSVSSISGTIATIENDIDAINDTLDDVDQLTTGTVKYTAQNLTESQQAQARANIGLDNISNMLSGVVKYTDQSSDSYTENEKAQARTNIGAASTGDISGIQSSISAINADILALGNNVADVTKTSTGIRVTYANSNMTPRDITIDTGSELANVTYTQDHYLHFYDAQENEMYNGPFLIEGGSGGSGSSTAGSASITRITDSPITCRTNESVPISFRFTSTDASGDPTTTGIGTWYVNNVIVARNISIKQGDNTGENAFDVGPYLNAGENTVKLTVAADVGTDTRQPVSKSWTVNCIRLQLIWNYNDEKINETGFTDTWMVYGDINKFTHTVIDPDTPDEIVLRTLESDRASASQSIDIPALSHGAHRVKRWVSATINSEPKSTEPQYHDMIFVSPGNSTPIIACSVPSLTMEQYDTTQIGVIVYSPNSLLSNATLYVDDNVVGTLNQVGRTTQLWSYSPQTSGDHVLKVVCGTAQKTITIHVDAVEMSVEEVAGYSYKFKASDFASNEAVRSWNSNGVTAEFSDNFDWVNGGLKTETADNGSLQQYFCVKAGTRMTINHEMFSSEVKTNGMNFKMIFKVMNCRKYDTEIAECYSGHGLMMTAHEATFSSSGASISAPYGEEEYIELEFDVYPSSNGSYLMSWMDGVLSSYLPYGSGDTFSFDGENKPLVIGSDDCDVLLYLVKVYPKIDITPTPEGFEQWSDIKKGNFNIHQSNFENHVANFIMDAPNKIEMAARDKRNNILDQNDEIDSNKLAINNPDLRVWLYDIPRITVDKDDKVSGCNFQQKWTNGDQYYTISGTGKMSVQGTSSVKYIKGAANTDINFTSLEDGYGNDLLEGGTKDEAYGNNWFIEDENNAGHAKQFNVTQARVAAGFLKSYTEAQAIAKANVGSAEQLGSSWVEYDTSNNLYTDTAEDDATKELGAEWIVIERDINKNPIKYIRALGMKLNDDSCPITYSNTKVNFASCEQVNNMCNAAWYQRFNPYPSMTKRDCMEFNMGVQFIKDGADLTGAPEGAFVLWDDNKYHMYSIANMGNSKKNVHVFHDMSNPTEVCIEVNDNNEAQMRMTNDDLSSETWNGKVFYGMRYPDTKNPSQEIRDAWQNLVTWFATRNPNAATGEALASPETYTPYTFRGHDRDGLQVLRGTTVSQYAGTYTHDTFNRRMAKMLSECEDHMVMDSFVYHFCYLERHTMVDNVCKNNFWSSTDLQHWDLSKAYDMDTSDGNNNQGQMVFDYGNEYDDLTNEGKSVFNANNSVWFVFVANLYEACATMFRNREVLGAWSSSEYKKFLLSEQRKVPERCWNQCFWYDYIRTYENNISDEWMTFLAGGQKTHQRSHYEYFQEQYESSKYRGTTSTSQNINFRGYTPDTWESVEPKGELTITMYNKMYVSIDNGTTALAPVKVERGVPTTITFNRPDEGGTQIVINSAPMIQEIEGMEHLYPDTCVFSEAKRLKRLVLGSDEPGYRNNFLTNLGLRSNPMLEELYVQNLPNAATTLDLSNCPSLRILDATGSGFTGYIFANGGKLTSAIINKPTSLIFRNLRLLDDYHLTIADYSALISLYHENTPGVSTLSIVNAAQNLRIARMIGINWELNSVVLLNRMYNSKGLNETGEETNRAILTGNVTVPQITETKYNSFRSAWPQLDVNYGGGAFIDPYTIRFLDWDGSPILDKNGNNYVQLVDPGEPAIEPIAARLVDTPVRESDAKFDYQFAGWDSLPDAVNSNKVITATYTPIEKTFTVRWYQQSGIVLKTVTGVHYGDQVVYEDASHNTPTTMEEDGTYYVFTGWDRSTGSIKGNTNVYATWNTSTYNASSTYRLDTLNTAQIYAVAANGAASAKWTAKSHIDIPVGHDFNFGEIASTEPGYVRSEVLATDEYFDGNTVRRTNIKLFDEDSPSFTLAIDFEFTRTGADATLVSCFDSEGSKGFRLRYYSGRPNVQWGDNGTNVGYGLSRCMTVIRYVHGTANLYVASSNSGSGVYALEMVNSEIPRAQMLNTDRVLTFGGVPLGQSGHTDEATGTIHWCKIWYDDLGSDAMRKLASWPHETWRMEYIDSNRFIIDDDNGTKTAASFIANAPLTLNYIMKSNGSNTGGFGQSDMNVFLNNRCFSALPTDWQALIKAVRLRQTTGGSNNAISNTTAKIYIPVLGEYKQLESNDVPYVSEGSTQNLWIPWISNRADRIKFNGITIPTTSRRITSDYDPTTLTGTYGTINNGDVWIRSNNSSRGYVYMSATEAAKHGTIGGRVRGSDEFDMYNIPAEGAQGGYWVLANSLWSRSAVTGADSSSYWTVNDYGYERIPTGANYVCGVVPMFSI